MLDMSLFPHSSKVPAFLPLVCLESVSGRLPETLALSAALCCLAPPPNLVYRAPSIKQLPLRILGLLCSLSSGEFMATCKETPPF